MSKDITVSEELREDRQIKCAKHGVKAVAGDIGFEISYGSYDEELEAVLLGTWEVDGGGTDIDRLKGGVTRRSFSLMRHFSDQLAADKPYYIYTGVEYNTLNLTVAPVGTLTGSFGTIGRDMSVNQTEPAGSTLGTTSANCPFNGFTGSVKVDGSVISIITELTLTLENGLEPRNVVGSDLTEYPTIGCSTLTDTPPTTGRSRFSEYWQWGLQIEERELRACSKAHTKGAFPSRRTAPIVQHGG